MFNSISPEDFPATGNGVNFGIVRLQTANLRFDWEHTSVVAGQDSLFISPLSPTSFASLATPAFAFAGNLWGWTPQLRVEHRFSLSDQQTHNRAGGNSRQSRLGISHQFVLPFGAGRRTCPDSPLMRCARRGRVRCGSIRSASASPATMAARTGLGAAMSTPGPGWRTGRFPLLPRLTLSGEFYRGRGIGGLGGAIGTSIVYGGDPTAPFTPIRGARHRRRMDPTEIPVDSEDRIQRRRRRRRRLRRRRARLRHRPEQFWPDSGTQSRRTGKRCFSSSLRPRALRGIPAIAHLPRLQQQQHHQSGQSIRGDFVLKTRSRSNCRTDCLLIADGGGCLRASAAGRSKDTCN